MVKKGTLMYLYILQSKYKCMENVKGFHVKIMKDRLRIHTKIIFFQRHVAIKNKLSYLYPTNLFFLV